MSERLIILAAGQGTRLRPVSDGLPKCMVPLHGRPLLEWHLDAAEEAGVDGVTVVAGYARDRLSSRARHVVVNERFASTNMVESLWCAEALFGDGFLVAYGDIVYRPEVLRLRSATLHATAAVPPTGAPEPLLAVETPPRPSGPAGSSFPGG